MIKHKISSFVLQVAGLEFDADVPFCVRAVLQRSELPMGDIGAASLSAPLSAVHPSQKQKFIRIKGFFGSGRVFLGDSFLGDISGDRESTAFDLSGVELYAGIELRIELSDALTCGIDGEVELLEFSHAAIDSVRVSRNYQGGAVGLAVRLDVLGNSENIRAVATLVSSAGRIYYCGLTRGKGNLVIPDPLYWWPSNLGVQNLYKLTVNLYGESEIEDTRELSLGFCHVTTADSGRGVILDVMGKSFLPMGAVLSEDEEPDSPRQREKKLISAVQSAADASFNTIVVPRSLRRLPDSFYSMCDKLGILVIHEFDDFSVRECDILRTRSAHPSLGLVDIIGSSEVLDEAIEKLHKAAPDIDFAHSEHEVSYEGELTLDTSNTLEKRFDKDDLNLFSEALEEQMDLDPSVLVSNAGRGYLYPKDLTTLSYALSLVAGDKLSETVKARRIMRGEGGRAVVSSLGLHKRSVSSSILDSSLVPKASAFVLSRALAPLSVFAREENGETAFYISNERKNPFSGEFEYRILDNINNIIQKEKMSCAVNEGTSQKIFAKDLSEWTRGHEKEYYIETVLREGGGIVAREVMLLTFPKRFKFADPSLRADLGGAGTRFTVTVSASAFARGVEVSLDGIDARFSDNYFDLTSQGQIKLSVITEQMYSPRELIPHLKLRSAFDIGR